MIRSTTIRRHMSSRWLNWPVRAAARGRWLVVLALLMGSGVCALPQAAVAQGVNLEYPLKAAFIYKFGSYIEWPANAFAAADSPFVIGVLGRSPIEAELRKIAATHRVAGRPMKIVRFDSVDKIQPCQVLFVAKNLPFEQQIAAIKQVQGMSVLTIGESTQFATDGGGLRFYVDNNKLRFEINVTATRQHNLKVSSQLLGLAKVIDGAGPK